MSGIEILISLAGVVVFGVALYFGSALALRAYAALYNLYNEARRREYYGIGAYYADVGAEIDARYEGLAGSSVRRPEFESELTLNQAIVYRMNSLLAHVQAGDQNGFPPVQRCWMRVAFLRQVLLFSVAAVVVVLASLLLPGEHGVFRRLLGLNGAILIAVVVAAGLIPSRIYAAMGRCYRAELAYVGAQQARRSD